MNKSNFLLLGIIVVLIIILLTVFIIDRFYSNKPECYFSKQNSCMLGYDRVTMDYLSIIPYYQCCRPPHYLLQPQIPTLYSSKLYCNQILNLSYSDGSK
jgi:hypothetical protein